MKAALTPPISSPRTNQSTIAVFLKCTDRRNDHVAIEPMRRKREKRAVAGESEFDPARQAFENDSPFTRRQPLVSVAACQKLQIS
jgi:hypothetical protein